MEYIMKILKLIEQSELLIKGVIETLENETKEQMMNLGMTLGTLSKIS